MNTTTDGLDALLKSAGWSPQNDVHRDRMHAAFRFIMERFERGYVHGPADSLEYGPGPWAFTIGGRTPRWLSWLQAIDFDAYVGTLPIVPGNLLFNYRAPGEGPGGNWYCDERTPSSRLALKPNQTAKHRYVITGYATALKSTAGDIMVDWNMTPRNGAKPTLNVDYWYRKGGGTQYLVPGAKAVLRHDGEARN